MMFIRRQVYSFGNGAEGMLSYDGGGNANSRWKKRQRKNYHSRIGAY